MHNIDNIRAEIENAVEQEYPTSEGLEFINVARIIDRMEAAPETYPNMSNVAGQTLRWRKAVCAMVMREMLGWERRSSPRRATAGAIYRRRIPV
ncbi:MAG: hypothetical protein PHF64_00735 [Methanoregula sp.]|nr:hypothetical protein [Methanoregula sp.]